VYGAIPYTCDSMGHRVKGTLTLGHCDVECTPGTGQCIGETTPQTCSDQGHWQTQPVAMGGPCKLECTPGSPVTPSCDGTKTVTCSAQGKLEKKVIAKACGAVCTPGEHYCDDGEGDTQPPCWGSGCQILGTNDRSAIQMGVCNADGMAQITTYCPSRTCPNSVLVAGCTDGMCMDPSTLFCP
jgi:hypothetical protein